MSSFQDSQSSFDESDFDNPPSSGTSSDVLPDKEFKKLRGKV